MKMSTALILTLALCLSLCACGGVVVAYPPDENLITDGALTGAPTEVKYQIDNALTGSQLEIHSILKRRLDNGHTRFTVEYTASTGLGISIFNPPSGDKIRYFATTHSDQKDTLMFDVSNEVLQSVENIVITFEHNSNGRAFVTIFSTEFVTDGTPTGPAAEVTFSVNNRLESAALEVHRITEQKLDNEHTRFTVEYTASAGLRILVFDSPDGEFIRYSAGTPTERRNTFIFDVSNDVLSRVEGIVMSFNHSSNDSRAFVAFFADRFVTDGTVTGTVSEVNYLVNNELPPAALEIHNITQQELDNGYIRFTLEYSSDSGIPVMIFDPPDGNLIRVSNSVSPGKHKNLVFDISHEVLQNTSEITILFEYSDSERAMAFILPGEITQNGAENNTDPERVSEGTAVGTVSEVSYTVSNELKSATLKIHSFTKQELDNGYTRFTVEYSTGAGMSILVFDPPDGNTVSHRTRTETGENETLVFDIPTEVLQRINNLLINFYYNDKDRAFVSFVG